MQTSLEVGRELKSNRVVCVSSGSGRLLLVRLSGFGGIAYSLRGLLLSVYCTIFMMVGLTLGVFGGICGFVSPAWWGSLCVCLQLPLLNSGIILVKVNSLRLSWGPRKPHQRMGSS